MVKSFKEFIGESTWGKMLDRGAGDAVRKEDDVNHFDLGEFYWEYLEKHYHIKWGRTMVFVPSEQTIGVPVLIKNTSVAFLITYNFRKKHIVFNSELSGYLV